MKPDYIKLFSISKYFIAWRISILTEKRIGMFIGKKIDYGYKAVIEVKL